MWTAILQALMAYVRSAGSQKPVEAAEPAPAVTLAGTSPEAVQEAAAAFAAPFEGFRPRPYLDPASVWTIGYGSTRDKAGMPVTASTPPLTEPQARELMARDMFDAVHEVTTDVGVPLTTNEEIALADFVYNLGAGNFRSSTLLKKLNAGDHAGAAAEFVKWDMAKGKVLAGLLKRRQAETELFQS